MASMCGQYVEGGRTHIYIYTHIFINGNGFKFVFKQQNPSISQFNQDRPQEFLQWHFWAQRHLKIGDTLWCSPNLTGNSVLERWKCPNMRLRLTRVVASETVSISFGDSFRGHCVLSNSRACCKVPHDLNTQHNISHQLILFENFRVWSIDDILKHTRTNTHPHTLHTAGFCLHPRCQVVCCDWDCDSSGTVGT